MYILYLFINYNLNIMSKAINLYYTTGELSSEYFILNGMKNGIYKSYHPNGQLHQICTYIDDKIIEKCSRYHENEYSIWNNEVKIKEIIITV